MTGQEKLIDSLRQFIERADDGERIPTVRDLMKTFEVGQITVQDAMHDLKSSGLVRSHVGRGSFVAKPKSKGSGKKAGVADLKSVLILSNVNMNARCKLVQSLVVNDIQAQGAQVVQMSYSDTDHLLAILKGIPSFDAVIMQSHYESIPIRLLAALKSKTQALIIDGLTLAGVDVDRVGVDWQEVVGIGLDHLIDRGCRKPALVTIDSNAQPMILTQRSFERLKYWAGEEISTSVHKLKGVVHPTQDPETALKPILEKISQSEVDSVLFLGMSETKGIDAALTDSGLIAPSDLAVVILGHTDVPSEHLDKYSIAGVSHVEGARELVDGMVRRYNSKTAAPHTRYLDVRIEVRASSDRK